MKKLDKYINIGTIERIEPITIDPGSGKVIEYYIYIRSDSNIVHGDASSLGVLGDDKELVHSLINKNVEFEIDFIAADRRISITDKRLKKIIIKEKEYPEIFGKVIDEIYQPIEIESKLFMNHTLIVDCGIVEHLSKMDVHNSSKLI